MKKILLLFTFLSVMLISVFAEEITDPGLYAKMETTAGTMVFKLDYENTPLTVINFVALSQGLMDAEDRSGAYYDGLVFFKTINKYAVFSGDTMGNGTGSPGYTFPREKPGICTAGEAGTLMMSALHDQSHGSHFFIMRSADAFLDSKYTPFGSMISGEKALQKISEKDSIKKVSIIRIGEEAESFEISKEKFEALLKIQKEKAIEALKTENPDLYAAIENLGPDYKRSPAGIYYSITKAGSGNKPENGQMVRVHYVGRLLDGTEFDNSRSRGQSFDLIMGQQQVIPGWIEVLMDMKPGESRTVIIPPEMAYGGMSVGPIPPNSWLVFDIEILSIR